MKYRTRIIPRIWYPGSAYASLEWINYLKLNFLGDWYYSDVNKLTWIKDDPIAAKPSEILHQSRIKFKQLDTFSNERDKLIKQKFNIIIISYHPGLRTAKDVVSSKILYDFNPGQFIYATNLNFQDLSEDLINAEEFKKVGYHLDKIVSLPHLKRVYCVYYNYELDIKR